MGTQVRRQVQMISLVLVLGLGLGLLVRMTTSGVVEPPGPTPAEAAAADRVTMLVAAAYGGWVPTTATLTTGERTVGGPETLSDVTLADPARVGLATLTAKASQRVAQDREPLEARVSARETVVEVDDDAGRTRVDATTAVVLRRATAADATVLITSTVHLDTGSGEVLLFEASGLD